MKDLSDSPSHVVLVRESREKGVVQLEAGVFGWNVASDESLDGLKNDEGVESARQKERNRREDERSIRFRGGRSICLGGDRVVNGC